MSLIAAFAAAMSRLGPYGAKPRLAIAVSGGADSTALALLAHDWASQNNGNILALIVDHGLRDTAAAEAALTAARLQARGIPSKILTLAGLAAPAIQEKARIARYEILAIAAASEGRLHLLLGHHQSDQSETVAMRAARGPSGAEGIAAWTARSQILLLRPLLGLYPAALRDYLTAEKMPWIEDPSNQNPQFERVRIRQTGIFTPAASAALRQTSELEAAAFLARHAAIRPEGFAMLDAAAAPPAALASLIRVIGGASYPPPGAAIAALSAKLRPATIAGVRIAAAGRLGPGWLIIREPAACAAPVLATPGAIWDRRFILTMPAPGSHFGALGGDARLFRKFNGLPSLVLRTMPCLRDSKGLPAFPVDARFLPPAPATSHPFFS